MWWVSVDLNKIRLKLATKSNKTRGLLFLVLVALEMIMLILALELGATLKDLSLWIIIIIATFVFSVPFFFFSDRKEY
jgi:hypothetical protein